MKIVKKKNRAKANLDRCDKLLRQNRMQLAHLIREASLQS
jgi:hypothetical protein